MKKLSLLIIAPLILAGLSSHAGGVPQPYWDANGTDATAGNNSAGGGSGSWDTTTSDWWLNGNSDSTWPAGDVANFAGMAGIVTVGAAVTADGLTFTTPGYTITGSAVTLTLGGTTPTITVPTGTTSISGGILGGTAGLTLSGPGTLVLSGANTYTGSTTINSGEIQVSSDATAASTAANLGKTPASATANNIILGGGTLSGTAGFTLYKNRGIQLTANSTIDTSISGTTTMIVAGPISQSSGTWGITKTSAGILSLTGANTFTGNITIDNGTFQIGGSGSLNGGNYAGNIAGSANALINGSEPATFNYDSSVAQTLSGVISGPGLIAQNGTGALTFTQVETYTGRTTIDHGKIILAAGASINNSPIIAIFPSGTFDVTAVDPYTLNSGTTIYGIGAGTAQGVSAATLNDSAVGGVINLASQPVNLFYDGSSFAGGTDMTQPSLYVANGALTFNNNQIGVSNELPTQLGPGTYNLIQVGNGSTGTINGAPAVPVIVIGGGQGWQSGLAAGTWASASVSGSDVIMTVATPPNPTTTTTPTALAVGESFFATVSPVPDGGVVQFLGNGLPLGTPVPVNTTTGIATLSSPLPVAGSYTDFEAIYSGDANYGASSSTTETLQVISIPPIQFSSQSVVGTGLQVCWPTYNGIVYNVLTNGNLRNGGPASWVQDTAVSPHTGDGNTDCVIIPSASLPSTNLFVLIKLQ